MGDVLLNKVAVIERCLQRVDDEYEGHEHELETNITKQDAIVLNLQRALSLPILRSVLDDRLDDFRAFAKVMIGVGLKDE